MTVEIIGGAPHGEVLKSPGSTVDYVSDWSTYLGADTISSVAWTVPTGLTKVTQSNDTTTTTVRVSGGAMGADYDLTQAITTAAGVIELATIKVKVRDL